MDTHGGLLYSSFHFRFFPIGLDVARIPQQNLVIGGYQIPAGVSIVHIGYSA